MRKKYVDLGWLDQPAHRVYRRPRGALRWQQVAISLQTVLGKPLVVGGKTALDLLGYAHLLSMSQNNVHLHGHEPPPSWLHKLSLPVEFVFHKSDRLFRSDPAMHVLKSLVWSLDDNTGQERDKLPSDFVELNLGQWDWPLTLPAPERAIIELLDELPDRESFHQVDKLMEGLADLSPRRLQTLLEDCKSVKVKRLFFFFADRHHHAWQKRIDRNSIDLGKGKRMLVRGGKLDPTYEITVPEGLDAV